MVFSTTWLEFKDMAQVHWSVESRFLFHVTDGLYTKEHPANSPLWWRLSNGLRVYLLWLQAGISHHTRQPNWWSVHQRRLATSCCPPFRQPPTSYKACVYRWQRQASSFKSCNRLPPKWSRDFCSLASHEPGFESHRAYLGHIRPSIQAREPPVQNIRQLGAALHREWQQLLQQDIRRLTRGMRRRVEAVIQARGGYTDLNPIEHIWDMLSRCIQARETHVQNIPQLEAALHREWWQLSHKDIRRLTGGMRRRVDAVIQARGGYTRYWTSNNRCRQVIYKWRFESEMTSYRTFEQWRSILKMDMFYCKNWPWDIVIKYSLN